jgi:hypothetical protein
MPTTQARGKKSRVLKEAVKELHTSHWDLDYVSREELERRMAKPTPVPNERHDQLPDGRIKP